MLDIDDPRLAADAGKAPASSFRPSPGRNAGADVQAALSRLVLKSAVSQAPSRQVRRHLQRKGL